ncbi:MAG: hypothetical protein EOO60_12295 [Hymenobacter sp.]|nr:MAG: hypothetical protein EOO60_12295 [Hymenobacter sp.]
MQTPKHTVLLLWPLTLLLGCQKVSLTPAAASSFSCLVNGQAWVPSGNNGTSNFQVTYEPDYSGGALQIKVYRYTGPGQGVLQGLTFGASNVTRAGVYTFPLRGPNGVSYADFGAAAPRDYYSSQSGALIYQEGTLTLTQFDAQQRLVSGTFTFKLAKTSGDTLLITQGNFETHF